MAITGTPRERTKLVASLYVIATSATSRTYTAPPGRSTTSDSSICSTSSYWLTTRTRTSDRDSASAPAEWFSFVARIAAASWSIVTPCCASRTGSNRICASRSRPPSTLISDTPGTRSRAGLMRSSAKSCSVRTSTAGSLHSNTIHAM
jgi:hypothetical protein